LAENISAHSASLRGLQRVGGTIADNHKIFYVHLLVIKNKVVSLQRP